LLLANPGLAGHGPLLALGTPVTLPDLPLAQPAVQE
jgi:phage tail protein X